MNRLARLVRHPPVPGGRAACRRPPPTRAAAPGHRRPPLQAAGARGRLGWAGGRLAGRAMGKGGIPPPEEMCIIVNDANEIVGHEPRSVTVSQRLHGRGSYCLVFNPEGQLFISKRSVSKDVYPGYYDVLISGVCNQGESYKDTVLRELEEEVGVDASATLEELFVFPYEDEYCHVWGCAFRCEVGGVVALQAEEVAWGEFRCLEEVRRMIEFEKFTPVGLHVLREYFARGSGEP